MGDEVSTLKRRVEELEEIHRLAQSLSSVLSVYETLEAVADSCLKLCGAERSAILLLNPASKDLAQTAVRSTAGSEREIDHLVNSLVVGWIVLHKKPLLTDDILEMLNVENPPPRLRLLGPTLAVPIAVQDEIIGVMNLVNSRGGAPFSADSLRVANILAPLAARFIDRASAHESLSETNKRLKAALHQQFDLSSIVGKNPAIEDIKRKISIVASSSSNVLITGETGTGKEIVSRAIHFMGARAEKPFVAVNCAAIPAALFESELFGHQRGAFTGATELKKGKFELAHEGTIFLDEISAMPLELQPKLLRVLEERNFSRVGSSAEINVDVRIIAASNQNLQEAIRAREFREDLYHRLNVVPIHLPPLRERREDISLLAQNFLQEFSGESKRFAQDAMEMLLGLEWRGNVRELRNIVERVSMFVASPEISASDLRSLGIGCERVQERDIDSALKFLFHTSHPDENLLDRVEKQLVRLALEQANGNVSKASQLLGIDRNALQRRLEKFQLK